MLYRSFQILNAVFHAGTKLAGDQFVGNGGRVLLVASEATTLKEAQEKVCAELTEWTNFFFRKDISWRTFK